MTDYYVDLGPRYDYYALFNFVTFWFPMPQTVRTTRRVRQLNGGDRGRVFSWRDRTGNEVQRNTVRANHSCLAITPNDAPLTYEMTP